MEVRGHSWETNLPARHVIYTRDLYEPVQELASRIAAAARAVLESTPPELAADVSGTGILLTRRRFAAAGFSQLYRWGTACGCGHRPRPAQLRGPRYGHPSLSEGRYLTAGFRDATPKAPAQAPAK